MAIFLLKKLRGTRLLSLVAFILVSININVSAHVLEETSAQVILRDGQVDIKIITNLANFIAVLQSHQAWLMGDTDRVMPANLPRSQQKEFIKKALTQKTTLMLNKQVVEIENIVLTGHLLSSDSEHSHHHISKENGNNQYDANNTEIILQGKHTIAEVNELSVSFHQGLGTVHLSIVKPQYKLLSAGESTHVIF